MGFEVETASPCATRLWQRAKEMSRVTLRPKSNLIKGSGCKSAPFLRSGRLQRMGEAGSRLRVPCSGTVKGEASPPRPLRPPHKDARGGCMVKGGGDYRQSCFVVSRYTPRGTVRSKPVQSRSAGVEPLQASQSRGMLTRSKHIPIALCWRYRRR